MADIDKIVLNGENYSIQGDGSYYHIAYAGTVTCSQSVAAGAQHVQYAIKEEITLQNTSDDDAFMVVTCEPWNREQTVYVNVYSTGTTAGTIHLYMDVFNDDTTSVTPDRRIIIISYPS